jgi:ribonuclease E
VDTLTAEPLVIETEPLATESLGEPITAEAPAFEAPVAEAAVVEAPVAEAAVVEAPVTEAPTLEVFSEDATPVVEPAVSVSSEGGPADEGLEEPVDYDSMKSRIESTRSRLKAKAFDAMMTGEAALLGRDLEGRVRDSKVSGVDRDIDETIETSLREEEE